MRDFAFGVVLASACIGLGYVVGQSHPLPPKPEPAAADITLHTLAPRAPVPSHLPTTDEAIHLAEPGTKAFADQARGLMVDPAELARMVRWVKKNSGER